MQEYDIAVIGAGSAGPKAARTAARLGAKVVIFEEALVGGECLYTGCVPSKFLIHAATLWTRMQRAYEFGLPEVGGLVADFGHVMRKARRMIETVGSGNAVESFSREGIDTVCERAVFLSPHGLTSQKTGREFTAKQVILCTGSLPAVPPIPGLADAGYETNRTIFEVSTLPHRMVVLGGGPIGCEIGQAFARFGAQVTIIHNGPRLLARDDHDAVAVLHQQLVNDGIRVLADTRVSRIDRRASVKAVTLEDGTEILCDCLLVATGRRANVDGLGLEAAGVHLDAGRLKTSDMLQTNVESIWAAGDVATDYRFTHVVSYEGAVAASNAVASLTGTPRCTVDYRVVPRVTYTDPEVASVGLTPSLARMSHGEDDIETVRFPFAHLDRALITGETAGFVQIVSQKRDGAILGAQIVGAHAGGLINEVCLAMRARLSVSDIALTMHAYPTFPEAVEAAAYETTHAPLSPCIPREMV